MDLEWAQAEIGILHQVCVGDLAVPATAFRPLYIKVTGASGGTSVESEASARQIVSLSLGRSSSDRHCKLLTSPFIAHMFCFRALRYIPNGSPNGIRHVMSSYSEITDFDAGSSIRTTHSDIIRRRLKRLCDEALTSLFPDGGQLSTGTWSDHDIRLLTALFEIERVGFQSELEKPYIHSSIIVKVLETLGTCQLFLCPGNAVLAEMEQYLRLFASALRLYKHHSTALEHQLHDSLYIGINKLAKRFGESRGSRGKRQIIEEGDIAFLLTHCQALLVSIQSSDSLAKKASRRFILAVDGALAGYGNQLHETRRLGVQLARRQRSRPTWHAQFLDLEDLCCAMFARDIRISRISNADLKVLSEDEVEACQMLYDSIEEYFQHSPRGSQKAIRGAWRRIAGRLTQVTMDSGPYEEHDEYLAYGILDLMYQLSFRIRARSWSCCLKYFATAVRLVLEKAAVSATLLRKKALDLWYRLVEIGERDSVNYCGPESLADFFFQNEDLESNDYAREFMPRSNPALILKKVEKSAPTNRQASGLGGLLSRFWFTALKRKMLTGLDIGWGPETVVPPPVPLRRSSDEQNAPDFRTSPVPCNPPDSLLELLRNIDYNRVGEEDIARILLQADVHHRILEYINGIEGSNYDPVELPFSSPLESLHLVSSGSTAPSQVDNGDPRVSSAAATNSGILELFNNTTSVVSESSFEAASLDEVDEMALTSLPAREAPTMHPGNNSSTVTKQQATFETWIKPAELLDHGVIDRKRRSNIIASCISSSGNTVGLVTDGDFTIFTISQEGRRRLNCIGVFSKKLRFQYGANPMALKSQVLGKFKGDARFSCGTVSDEFLAIGGINLLMVFSISQGGRCILEHQIPFEDTLWRANKLLFDQDSTHLIAVFTNTVIEREMAQIFTLNSDHSSGSNPAEAALRGSTANFTVSESVSWRIGILVKDNGTDAEYIVSTSCSALSSDGSKLALCSHHVRGCAVIRLMITKDGSWRFWGVQQLVIHSDHRDWSLPGFTGVDL